MSITKSCWRDAVEACRSRRLARALFVGMLFTPGIPLLGQEPACSDLLDVDGWVQTPDGQPIGGASVVMPSGQLRTMTDSTGYFMAQGVCPGLQRISVQHDAYAPVTEELDLRHEGTVAGTYRLEVELSPRALGIEGLVVEVQGARDILERRRTAHGFQSEALDVHAAFPTGRLPYSLAAHLAVEAGYPLRDCPGSSLREYNCYPFRGRVRAIRACLDEVPLQGGVQALEAIPQASIARMEFYPGSGVMKVYTRRFMDQVSQRPWLVSGTVDQC